ncbi:MAG: alanine dehydrogenase [Gammaproteobacteria bacterium]|nr:alanine dehydrogenase [Gammaproteobacteria bacterium]MBT8150758.1 alanine dehydrogenase [Gammaproteobacteria bacterium]NNL10495.1 alanine dehydrogenase [Pseudomonadales bacterium]NNM11616.1 alanine dehydrogenase [Pseudomonadales bacterium]
MIIGIPKERKPEEHRVALTPGGAEILSAAGHKLLVETGAGLGSEFTDDDYRQYGASIVEKPETIFAQCEMVLHVKEPTPEECSLLRSGQIVFTYLHLAANAALAKKLIAKDIIAIAYETIQTEDKTLPLLTPMSEVAGRMAIQQGAKFLEMAQGGNGVLLGGVPGVDPGTVIVLGGGVAGTNAAKSACGLGANVYVFDKNLDRLRYLSDVMPANCTPLMYKPATLRRLLPQADVIVGAVLLAGARAPRLVSRDMLALIKKGAVMVDLSIDQGGCFETSAPTTHRKPTFVVDGVIHYCVANMPGAVAKTSTLALTNATLPYVQNIADLGWREAARQHSDIAKGLNIVKGNVCHPGVAEAIELPCVDLSRLLA